MIYILEAHVAYAGSEIICATSTIPTLVSKIQKIIASGDHNFGERCTIEIFNGVGTRIGEIDILHSEIPGKRLTLWTTGTGDYQEPTSENYAKLIGILNERAHQAKREFAAKNLAV